MMNIRRYVIATLAMAVLLPGLSSCKQGPAERAGQKIDKAVEKSGEQIEKAGKNIREGAKE
jgi:hypothetical protein